jgi:hypothetical protein
MFEVLFEVLDKSAAKKAPAEAAKSGLHVVAGAQPVTAAVRSLFVLKSSQMRDLMGGPPGLIFFRNSSFSMRL